VDVVGFLYVSLGSSTIQLHDSVGSRRACHVQRLVSVVKMATVLRGVLTKSSVLLCVFRGQRDSVQRIFINKYFLYTAGSICGVKRFTTGSRNSLKDVWKLQMRKRRCGSGWDNSQKTSMMGIRRTGRKMGRMYQCWWRLCREINVLPGSNIRCLTFYFHFWPVYLPFFVFA
jgi:hypothetical protein